MIVFKVQNCLQTLRMGKKTTVEQDEKSQSAMAEHSSLWNRFLLFMISPTDPSNLAVLRIIFGKTVVFV